VVRAAPVSKNRLELSRGRQGSMVIVAARYPCSGTARRLGGFLSVL
jgi:hypothetical protein